MPDVNRQVYTNFLSPIRLLGKTGSMIGSIAKWQIVQKLGDTVDDLFKNAGKPVKEWWDTMEPKCVRVSIAQDAVGM
jgi:hypothetical protein